MKRVILIIFVCVLVFTYCSFSVFALDSSIDNYIYLGESLIDFQFDLIWAELEEDLEEDDRDFVYSDSQILDDIYFLIYELSLGMSDEEYVEPPELHRDFLTSYSIGTQSNYPYTGGGFISVNSPQGNGIIVVPENYKTNYFGFYKGTDRLINLNNDMITGYWIVGGNTYNLQVPRYGVPRYQYSSGSSWYWADINTTKVNDTNIQFLDETGERGVENPVFSITDKLLILFMVLIMLSHALIFMKGR